MSVGPEPTTRQLMDFVQEWVLIPIQRELDNMRKDMDRRFADQRSDLYKGIGVAFGLMTMLLMLVQVFGFKH